MKSKTIALSVLVVAAGVVSSVWLRKAPPADLRDAVASGAPEFNTDVKNFWNESSGFQVPKPGAAKAVESFEKGGSFSLQKLPGGSLVTLDSRTGLMWVTDPETRGSAGPMPGRTL